MSLRHFLSNAEFCKKDCAISTQQKLEIQGNEGAQTLQWGALKEASIQRNICGFPRAKFFGVGLWEMVQWGIKTTTRSALWSAGVSKWHASLEKVKAHLHWWEVYTVTRQMNALWWWVRKHGRSKVALAQTTVCGGKLLKYCLHLFQGVRHPKRVSGFSSKSSLMCKTWWDCIRVSHICYKQQVSYESYLDWPTGFPVKRDGIGCFYTCNHCICGSWLRT